MIGGGAARGGLVFSAGSGGPIGGLHGWWWRLCGVAAPAVRLPFAPGELHEGSMVSLAELARRRSLAVFFYRGLGSGGVGDNRDEGWEVEMARIEGWRECEPELEEMGYEVVGVSTQSPEMQAQLALYRLFSFMLLSDSGLLLADELGLPTKHEPSGVRVHEPLTMLFRAGHITWVFYPVDQARDARNVTDWLRSIHV
jgi:peroxiredoxin